MMWIFEWDIVTGDSAALDSIYAVSRDDLDAAIADGAARGRGRRGDARAGRRDRPRRPGAPPSCTGSFVDALDYETDLLRHARRLPRDGPAARAVARHRQRDRARPVAGGRAGVPRGPRPRTSSGTRATSTCPRTASPPPTSAATAPTATRRWHGLARGLLARGRRRAGCSALTSAARPRRGGAARPGRRGHPAVAARRACPAPTTRTDRVLVWALPAVVLVVSRCVLHLVRGPRAPASRRSAPGCVLAARAALGGPRPRPVPPVGGARRRGPAAHRDPARRARGPRARAATGSASGPIRRARTVYVTVAFAAFCWLFVVVALVLRRAYGLGATPVARRDPRWPAGVALAVVGRRCRGDRPGDGADGLERPDGAAAVGPVADPRHHRAPRHPAVARPAVLAVVGLVVAVVGVALALLGRRRLPPDRPGRRL